MRNLVRALGVVAAMAGCDAGESPETGNPFKDLGTEVLNSGDSPEVCNIAFQAAEEAIYLLKGAKFERIDDRNLINHTPYSGIKKSARLEVEGPSMNGHMQCLQYVDGEDSQVCSFYGNGGSPIHALSVAAGSSPEDGGSHYIAINASGSNPEDPFLTARQRYFHGAGVTSAEVAAGIRGVFSSGAQGLCNHGLSIDQSYELTQIIDAIMSSFPKEDPTTE